MNPIHSHHTWKWQRLVLLKTRMFPRLFVLRFSTTVAHRKTSEATRLGELMLKCWSASGAKACTSKPFEFWHNSRAIKSSQEDVRARVSSFLDVSYTSIQYSRVLFRARKGGKIPIHPFRVETYPFTHFARSASLHRFSKFMIIRRTVALSPMPAVPISLLP